MNLKSPKLIKWLSISALITVLTLLFLPIVIKHVAISQLSKHGLEVQIANVDLNLFSGEFKLEGLTETHKGTETKLHLKQFYIEFDWLPLLQNKVQINQLLVESLHIDIVNKKAGLKIASIIIPNSKNDVEKADEKQEKTSKWFVSLQNLNFDDIKVSYQDDKLKLPLQITTLQLDTIDTQNVNKKSQIDLAIKLNESTAIFKVIGDVLNPNAFIKTELKITDFAFLPFEALLPTQVKLSKGATKMTSFVELTLHDFKPLLLVHNGELAINDVKLSVDDNQITNQTIKWQGRNEITFSADGNVTVNNKGLLNNKNLQLSQTLTGTTLNVDSFNFDGTVDLNSKNLQDTLKVLATVKLDKLRIESATKAQKVLMDSLLVKQLTTNGINDLKIDAVQINGVAVLDEKSKQPLYKSERLSVNKIQLENLKSLSVKLVEQHNQSANIIKNKQEELNLLQFIAVFIGDANKESTDSTDSDKDENENASGSDLLFNIRKLEINGKNTFSYRDLSLKPTFKKAVSLDRLVINNINNSSAKQVITYQIAGKILPNSPYSIIGDITPFAEKLSLNTKVKTEGIGLLEYSSFILPVTGYQIESGEADTDLDIKIKNNVIDAKNKITIHQLSLLESDPKTAKKLNSTISMPMDKALDLLRDDNNTIVLNIPLKGELDNLSVDPNDTINLALGNALKTGSKVYIATALFPYGTLYTLVKIAGEKINAIKLKPVDFAVGENILSVKDKDYLNKVAGILKNKKQLRVRLCAKATVSDKVQMQSLAKKGSKIDWAEELLLLADKRKIAIESYLSNKHKIKPNKLIDCRAVIEKDKAAKPRVDLLI